MALESWQVEKKTGGDGGLRVPFQHVYYKPVLQDVDYIVNEVEPSDGVWLDGTLLNGGIMPGNDGCNAAVTLVDANGSSGAVAVRLWGTDQFGNTHDGPEHVDAVAGSTIQGARIYRVITKMQHKAVNATSTVGDTIAVGNGLAIGLPQKCRQASDIYIFMEGSVEALDTDPWAADAAVFDFNNHSVTPAAPPDDTISYLIQGQSSYGVPS